MQHGPCWGNDNRLDLRHDCCLIPPSMQYMRTCSEKQFFRPGGGDKYWYTDTMCLRSSSFPHSLTHLSLDRRALLARGMLGVIFRLEIAQQITHTHTPGGSVCGWSCTSCTGELVSVAQSTSVSSQCDTWPPWGSTLDWYIVGISTGVCRAHVSSHVIVWSGIWRYLTACSAQQSKNCDVCCCRLMRRRLWKWSHLTVSVSVAPQSLEDARRFVVSV